MEAWLKAPMDRRPPVCIIAEGIFETADRMCHDGCLTQNEAHTYLTGTIFAEFQSWLTIDRYGDVTDQSKGISTKFKHYCTDGSMTLKEMLPAVNEFLAENPDKTQPFLEASRPIVKEKERMMAAIEAKRAAAEAAEAAAEKIAWTEGSSPAPGWSKHIYNLSHAAFDAADRGSRDGSLSANEMRTFLPGSRFRHFGHWFCRDRKPRSYFQSFAQGDGSIEVEELYPAVHKYLAEFEWRDGLIVKDSPPGAELVAAEEWHANLLKKQARLEAARAAKQLRIKPRRKTSQADIDVLCDAVFTRADRAKSGEVSGNELNNNLQGTAYEPFARWALKGRTAPFKKYDVDGGGTIGQDEMLELVGEYLGDEMTTIAEKICVEAYRWQDSRRKAERRQQKIQQAKEDSLLSRSDGNHKVARAIQKRVLQIFEQAHKRGLVKCGKLQASDLALLLHNSVLETFGFWARDKYARVVVDQLTLCLWYSEFQVLDLAAVKLQALARSFLSRAHQRKAMSERLHESMSETLGSSVSMARITMLLPPSPLALLVIAVATTSPICQLILPSLGTRTAHGIAAIQSFVDVREAQLGKDHPETISYAEQLGVAAASIAMLHSLLPTSEPDQAVAFLRILQKVITEYALGKNSAIQLELLLLEVMTMIAYRQRRYQQAADTANELVALAEHSPPFLQASYNLQASTCAAATGVDWSEVSTRIQTKVLPTILHSGSTVIESHMLRSCSSSALLQIQMLPGSLQAVAQYNLAVATIMDSSGSSEVAAQASATAFHLSLECTSHGSSTTLLTQFNSLYKFALSRKGSPRCAPEQKLQFNVALGHAPIQSLYQHLEMLKESHQCSIPSTPSSGFASSPVHTRPVSAITSSPKLKPTESLRPKSSSASRGARGLRAAKEAAAMPPVDSQQTVSNVLERVWWNLIM